MMICKLDIHCILCDSSCPDYIEVEPVRRGHWVYEGNVYVAKCSECGNFLDMCGVNVGRGDANYCPNCGARMEDEDEAD